MWGGGSPSAQTCLTVWYSLPLTSVGCTCPSRGILFPHSNPAGIIDATPSPSRMEQAGCGQLEELEGGRVPVCLCLPGAFLLPCVPAVPAMATTVGKGLPGHECL
jgi:hypothetical protein